MGDGSSKYNISSSNIGAVGDNAQAHDLVQVSSQLPDRVDLNALAVELALLLEAAGQENSSAEHDGAVEQIAAAEAAAKKGDKKAVLEHLASAGKWALDIATKIGVALAVEVIKKALAM